MKRLTLVLFAIALAACDSSGGSAGIVVGPDGAPIKGANVSLHCPAPNKTRDATTDSTGHYDIYAIAMDGVDCIVTITKTGYTTKTMPVTDTCHNLGGSASKCPTPPRIQIDPQR